MTFEAGGRPARPAGPRWIVRLFETSDKLEEHLNRSGVRPEQVASINIDADGFFVLVYHLGGGPSALRPAVRPEFSERRPPPRRRFDEGGFEDEATGGPPPFRGGGRPFEREGGGGARRDLPPRRGPRR